MISKIFLAVVILALAQNSQSQLAGSCSTQTNFFLSWLSSVKSSAVSQSFQASSTTFTICNEEWKTIGGTCCVATELKSFFDERARAQKVNWGNFFSSVKRLNNNLANIKKVAALTDQTKAAFDQLNPARLTELGMTSVEASSALAKAAIAFESDVKNLRTTAQDCFKNMNMLRGKIYCIGCSGNSDVNFASNNGVPYIKYSPASCNNLVTKCIKPWSFMARVQTTVSLLVHFTNAKKGTASTSTASKNPAKMFFRQKKAGDMYNIAEKCTAGLSSTCLQADMDSLCEAFFSFAHGPKSTDVPQADTDTAQNAPTTRLVQSIAEDEDSGYVKSSATNGIDLSASTSGLSSSESLDTSLLPASSRLFTYVNYLLIFFVLLMLN